MQQFEVSREDDIFEGHPAGLVRTESDRLVCFFMEHTHHGASGYDRGVYTVSDDRGRTWSEKRPLTRPSYHPDDPQQYQSDAAVLHDGRIVAATYASDPDPAVASAGDYGPRARATDVSLWISDDEADSWRGPRDASIEGHITELVELSAEHHDNRWIAATWQDFEESHEYSKRVQTYISDDEGETWDGPHTVATDHDHPLNDGLGDDAPRDTVGKADSVTGTFSETSLLELPEGELVAFVRDDSNQGLDLFKTISEDGGETWEGPYTMPVPGPHKPMGGMLNSGRVMLTYRFVQGGGSPFWGAQNTFAALTDVQSCLATDRADAQANILPLDHDAALDSDTGYTDWVQFDDGEIYAVNYVVDAGARPERTKEPPGYDGDYAVYPRAHIRGYSFYEDEFMTTTVPRAVAKNHPSGEDAIREWADRTGYDIEETD
jgi:sialidase-1